MKIKKTWTASSKPEEFRENEEFVNMAGQWNMGVEVNLTNPCSYLQGPVQKVIAPKEIHRDRIGTF
jgi:hypothetical protein